MTDLLEILKSPAVTALFATFGSTWAALKVVQSELREHGRRLKALEPDLKDARERLSAVEALTHSH